MNSSVLIATMALMSGLAIAFAESVHSSQDVWFGSTKEDNDKCAESLADAPGELTSLYAINGSDLWEACGATTRVFDPSNKNTNKLIETFGCQCDLDEDVSGSKFKTCTQRPVTGSHCCCSGANMYYDEKTNKCKVKEACKDNKYKDNKPDPKVWFSSTKRDDQECRTSGSSDEFHAIEGSDGWLGCESVTGGPEDYNPWDMAIGCSCDTSAAAEPKAGTRGTCTEAKVTGNYCCCKGAGRWYDTKAKYCKIKRQCESSTGPASCHAGILTVAIVFTSILQKLTAGQA